MNLQQRQQYVQRQMQQQRMKQFQGQQPAQPAQPTPQQPPQPTPRQQPQQMGHQMPQQQMGMRPQGQPAQGQHPQMTVTQQDYTKYSPDALLVLQQLRQQGKIPQQLSNQEREAYIHKYILMQKKKELNAARMAQPPQQPQQQQPPQAPTQSQAPMQLGMASNGMMNRLAPMATPQPAQQPAQQPPAAQPALMGARMPAFTEEMKVRLQQLFQEVQRNNVVLPDVTNELLYQDRQTVLEQIVRISQQYATIDRYITYFYMISNDEEITKKLIRMKVMTGQILEHLRRDRYLARPELLNRLKAQFQKCYDYVKEFVLKRQGQAPAGQALPPPPQFTPMMSQAQPMFQQPAQQPQQPQQPQQFQQPPMQPVPAQLPDQWGQRSLPLMTTLMLPAMAPTPAPAAKKTPAQQPAATRRKLLSNKGPINAALIPTPPNAMALMRTPNLIPTPHPPALQLNKNTPQTQLPQFVKNTPLAHSDDVFAHLADDAKLAKRREMLATQPEHFFYALLANLLELDEPLAQGEIPGPVPGKLLPLSPAMTEWTCEIKLEALTLAFRQVGAIRELVLTDIIDTCNQLATEERTKRPALFDDDIDQLFGEKKPKLEDFDKLIHEPVLFDDWKLFVVPSIQ